MGVQGIFKSEGLVNNQAMRAHQIHQWDSWLMTLIFLVKAAFPAALIWSKLRCIEGHKVLVWVPMRLQVWSICDQKSQPRFSLDCLRWLWVQTEWDPLDWPSVVLFKKIQTQNTVFRSGKIKTMASEKILISIETTQRVRMSWLLDSNWAISWMRIRISIYSYKSLILKPCLILGQPMAVSTHSQINQDLILKIPVPMELKSIMMPKHFPFRV